MTGQEEQGEQLAALALGTPWFRDALQAAARLDLAHWCIGAGAVRNLVWDALHGFTRPSSLPDIDLAYFDPADTSAARDAALQARLAADDGKQFCPEPTNPAWEVTNQAGVHRWFEQAFGHAVPPLLSLEHAVASWPEFATSVGVTLLPDGRCRIIAPHGLDDLFSMVIRRNPARVSLDTFRQRVAQKCYQQRWPKVRIVMDADAIQGDENFMLKS